MNGHVVHQIFQFLAFTDEILAGELQGFFDYLLDIDNQIKKWIWWSFNKFNFGFFEAEKINKYSKCNQILIIWFIYFGHKICLIYGFVRIEV